MLGPCHRVPNASPFRWKRLWRRAAAATVSVVAAAPVVERAKPAVATPAPYENGVHRIMATAYCLDGRMANGEPTHDGAAGMRGVPLGTPVTILDGPEAGRVLVVKDRPRRRGILDIWMPDCQAARRHGAAVVTIQLGA
jgi:3D (Asp-Asp-Asp) domain-containing protein